MVARKKFCAAFLYQVLLNSLTLDYTYLYEQRGQT